MHFWDTLSRSGHKIGLFNFPILFPPYKIDGFMVSGAGSPRESDITFPRSLKKEIDKIACGYELIVDYHNEKYNFENRFLRDLNRVLDKKAKVFHYLLTHKTWDFFLAIFSCTDWLQHFMWKHLESSHPLHDPASAESYKQAFTKVWEKVDKILKKAIELSDTPNVFVVSDHGFGPQKGCFYVNTWLEREGFLVRRQSTSVDAHLWAKGLFKGFLKPFLDNQFFKRVLKKLYGQPSIEDQIDFKRSRAFAPGHTIPFGAIYLNTEGREPYGFIKRGKEYARVREDICKRLQKIGEKLGRDLQVTIFTPEKIYNGDKLHLAPDVIFTVNSWECVVVDSFADQIYSAAPYSPRHTGSHRMNGIFLAYGPDIRKRKKINGVRIYDIAPTVLHMFNSTVPRTLDGRVLTDIFREDSEFAQRDVKYETPFDEEARFIRARVERLRRENKL